MRATTETRTLSPTEVRGSISEISRDFTEGVSVGVAVGVSAALRTGVCAGVGTEAGTAVGVDSDVGTWATVEVREVGEAGDEVCTNVGTIVKLGTGVGLSSQALSTAAMVRAISINSDTRSGWAFQYANLEGLLLLGLSPLPRQDASGYLLNRPDPAA